MFLTKLLRDQWNATYYRRLLYGKMREMITDHRSPRHRRLYALDCVIFLYAHRLLWIVYLINVNFEPIRHDLGTLRNDIVLAFAYTNPLSYTPILALMLYLFQAFTWTTESLMWRFDPGTITWRAWYEMVVESQDRYRAATLPGEVIAERRRGLEHWYSGPSNCGPMWVPSVVRRVYCSIAARVRLWWTLSDVDRRRLFAERPGDVLPKLSRRLRRKMILLLVLTDYVAICFQATISLVFAAMIFEIGRKANSISYAPLAYVRIIVELYFVHYSFLRLIHLAIFFTCCAIFGPLIFGNHVINITRPVDALIWRFRQTRQQRLNPESSNFKLKVIKIGRLQQSPVLPYGKYRAIISRQLADHNKISYFVVRGSLELFGSVMFAFLPTHIPVNILLIRQMWFTRSTAIELITAGVIFSFQAFSAIFGVVGPLSWCCAIYHSPKRFIPRLQAITGKAKWLRLKLKYDDLYGRLMSGPKIGVSIGPTGTITYKWAFEFVLLYVAYLLMAFSQQIENDLKRSEETIAKLTENLNLNVKN